MKRPSTLKAKTKPINKTVPFWTWVDLWLGVKGGLGNI